MKCHRSLLRSWPAAPTLGAVALLAVLAEPAAAARIGLAPAAQMAPLGSTARVDIVFSELGGEIVSAYDLDVLYDPAILSATDVLFSSALGDELFFEVLNDFDLSSSGVVDLAQVSLLSDAVLAALQPGDSLVAATLVFDAVGVGTSQLGFVFDAVNDVKGGGGLVLPLGVDSGSISVAAPVPEPSAALLFAVGVAIVVGPLRRRRTAPDPGRRITGPSR